MNYFNFIEERVEPKQLLWNHYINCCKVLGLNVDTSLEDYFTELSEDQVNKFINFLNLDLH